MIEFKIYATMNKREKQMHEEYKIFLKDNVSLSIIMHMSKFYVINSVFNTD